MLVGNFWKQIQIDTKFQMKVVFYVTAGIGGLIFLTGFLGCCGAGCENTCLLGLVY